MTNRADLFAPARRHREARRYLPANEAARLAREPTTVLVDIRRPEEFASLHAPGALNIPASQVKDKGFLRGKRLILISDGLRYRTQEDLAVELEKLGFSEVGIVEGGLAAWQQVVGGLAGSGANEQFRSITPGDYLFERVFDHWRIVRSGALAEAPGGQQPLPADLTIASDEDPAKLREQLDGLTQPLADGLHPLVLVAGARDEDYLRIKAAMRGQVPWNLLFLEGGMEGYAKTAAALQAMWNHHPRPRGSGCGRH